MIIGIGTDLVKNSRVKFLYEKYKIKFLKRVFTQNEIEYSFSKNDPYLHLSGRWAAKEAVWKSLRINHMLKPLWIEILSDENGIPRVNVLSDYLSGIITEKKVSDILVSISHEKEYSLSFVILEGGNIK